MERRDIKQAIEEFEDFGLTEEQWKLIDYLRVNIDDVEEALKRE